MYTYGTLYVVPLPGFRPKPLGVQPDKLPKTLMFYFEKHDDGPQPVAFIKKVAAIGPKLIFHKGTKEELLYICIYGGVSFAHRHDFVLSKKASYYMRICVYASAVYAVQFLTRIAHFTLTI